MVRASNVLYPMVRCAVAMRTHPRPDGSQRKFPATHWPVRPRYAFAVVAAALFLSSIACDEFQSLANQAQSVVSSGSCWSEGEKITEVTDDDGNSHRLYPAQIASIRAEGLDIWLCGVDRSVEPADIRFSGDKPVAGFYLPSGKPIHAVSDHKFWILDGGFARWYHE